MVSPDTHIHTYRSAVESYRGLVAHSTLHHVLMKLAIQVNERLTHPAVDDGYPPWVGTGDGCVGGREFSWRGETQQLVHDVCSALQAH